MRWVGVCDRAQGDDTCAARRRGELTTSPIHARPEHEPTEKVTELRTVIQMDDWGKVASLSTRLGNNHPPVRSHDPGIPMTGAVLAAL